MSITAPGVAAVQNFTIGSTATAALPSGFNVGTGTPGLYSSGVGTTTLAAGTTGTGVLSSASGGGYYNFGYGITASATDRSVGFLTSSSVGTSPSLLNLMLQIQNNTGGVISDLAITFDYEKYRSGSRAFNMLFFK